MKQAPVFDEIYKQYLADVSSIDMKLAGRRLGIVVEGDEEFPAECSILFEKHSDAYLDMECLAMLGMVLATWLKNGPDYKDGNI